MTVDTNVLAIRSSEELLRRNNIFEAFFRAQAPRLAEACHEMSRRFLAGGRLLAFGNGPAATDAQHVSVEFVHPVIVGKHGGAWIYDVDSNEELERLLAMAPVYNFARYAVYPLAEMETPADILREQEER